MILGIIIVTCLVMIAVINLYMKVQEKREENNNEGIKKILKEYKEKNEKSSNLKE